MSPLEAGRRPTMEALMCVLLSVTPMTGACSSNGTVGDPGAAGQSREQTADTAFAAMQARGKAVMGVDQYMSKHTFEDLGTGGRIVLKSDTGEERDVAAIRAHLQDIAKQFARGDFTNPSIVHAGAVPGTDVMTRKAGAIRYAYADLPRGGEVKIETTDAAALAAIREFLSYQRTAHRAHDMH